MVNWCFSTGRVEALEGPRVIRTARSVCPALPQREGRFHAKHLLQQSGMRDQKEAKFPNLTVR